MALTKEEEAELKLLQDAKPVLDKVSNRLEEVGQALDELEAIGDSGDDRLDAAVASADAELDLAEAEMSAEDATVQQSEDIEQARSAILGA